MLKNYFKIILKICLWSSILFHGFVSLAAAEWRNDVGIFRIGIVVEGEPSSYFIKLDPFRRALAEALNIEVEFYPTPDAISIINAFRDERIEYAILPASAYALAWNVCECVEPIVAPRAGDSTDGYHMVLIAPPEGAKSLEELEGKKISILSKGSLTGRELPMQLLKEAGLKLDEGESNVLFAGTASKSISDFIQGNTNALIGWSSLAGDPSAGYTRGTLTAIYKEVGAEVRSYSVLWKSKQFSNRPHVIRKKLSGEAKRILRDTLLALYESDPVAYDAIEPVYSGGFAASRQDRFTDLIEFMDGLYKEPQPSDIEGAKSALEKSKDQQITSGIDD